MRHDAEGQNIEAAKGGLLGDNAPYVNNMPITPEAIENRVRLATLTNDEVVADTLLDHYTSFAYAMVKKCTAGCYLLKTEFYDRHSTAADVPENQRSYLAYLQRVNQSTFDRAAFFGLAASRQTG